MSMRDSIARYNATLDQLESLKKMQKSEQYMGSGLTISLWEGPHTAENCTSIEHMQICDLDVMPILIKMVIRGLEHSLELQLSYIKSEIKCGTTFLDDRGQA